MRYNEKMPDLDKKSESFLNRNVFFLAGIFVLTALSFAFIVSAASPDNVLFVPNPVKADNLTELLADIANFIFIIAIPIAVIAILISGIKYLTAGGNEDKINSARRALVWTAVGLVIILIGKGIISVIQSLLSVTVK